MTIADIYNKGVHSRLDVYILARWFYAISDPIMSDAMYNIMHKQMVQKYPDSPYVNRSWSSDPCPVELLKRIGREDAIQAIVLADKTESIESLNSWTDIKDKLGNLHTAGTLSFKHDGWNMQASYYNGSLVCVNSRGRTTDSLNADVLCALLPKEIPVQGMVKVVMECTLPNDSFEKCKQLYDSTSQRASVSTILRAHPENVSWLALHAFDIHGCAIPTGMNKFEYLTQLGFKTPSWIDVYNYDDIESGVNKLSISVLDYDYPTDGVVIDAGFKYALRVEHWEEPIMYSYVEGYEISYNRHVISPKLKIHPVERNGATQRTLTITNWQRIIDLGLKIGAPVAFSIASSAIAVVDEGATLLMHKEMEEGGNPTDALEV